MLKYIARRIGVAVFIVVASTALSFFLVVMSGDPLEDLAQLRGPEKASKTALRTAVMHLDKPPVQRYGFWLQEVGRCITAPFSDAECTLGLDRAGRPVLPQLTGAMGSTLRLVVAATILALLLGILVGLVTALRQYSAFDYGVTLVAFLCFSLPSFWVATLLKQYAAIDLNAWLMAPTVGPATLLVLAVVGGLIWMVIIGGNWRRRLLVLGLAAIATALPLELLLAVDWFAAPSLGLIGIILSAAALALLWTVLLAGLRPQTNRVLYTALVTAGLGVGVYLLLNFVIGQIWDRANEWLLISFGILAVVVGALVGRLLGGHHRAAAMKVGALTAFSLGVFIAADRLLLAYPRLVAASRGHPISTTGSQTPNLPDDFWFISLDRLGHLMLPTMAIVLVSFASYTRYTRAITLDVLNQDYVRTARSKGLAERTVVVRHAFRNVLIPISTLIALDFAGIMSGAVVTETVFGWSGMGKLFSTALTNVDPNPLMAFMLVTAVLIVLMNLVSDIAYAFLDPRIRLK
jgi:peptide/nickel transport system permease protein